MQNGTYQVGDHDLGLTTSRASGCDGGGLVLLRLASGLLDTADGGVGSTTTGTATAVAAATACGGAGSLEDVVQGRVELVGAGHVGVE